MHHKISKMENYQLTALNQSNHEKNLRTHNPTIWQPPAGGRNTATKNNKNPTRARHDKKQSTNAIPAIAR